MVGASYMHSTLLAMVKFEASVLEVVDAQYIYIFKPLMRIYSGFIFEGERRSSAID